VSGVPPLAMPDGPTKFERTVARLGLADTPEAWAQSKSLRDFVKANKNKCYIPEWLIDEMGLAGFYEGD